MSELDALVVGIAGFTQVLFELASVLVVAAGGIMFVYAAVARHVAKKESRPRFVLARYLVIALELQLAADIIATATHPSLEELGKLAIIAVIRTFLNYFLVLETRQEKANELHRVIDH